QGGVVLSPSHQRQFLSRSGLYQTLAYGCRTSPLGGAKYDDFPHLAKYQTVSSSHNKENCHSGYSSEVATSKSLVFHQVQNFQTIRPLLIPTLPSNHRKYSIFF
ncbi:MAG TPA: hypothetical protein PLT50_03295, partial [bacterium]|nr:hypothetical protein [bacterium]